MDEYKETDDRLARARSCRAIVGGRCCGTVLFPQNCIFAIESDQRVDPSCRAHAAAAAAGTAVDAPRQISLLMPHFSRTPLSFLIVGPTYAEDGFSFLAG